MSAGDDEARAHFDATLVAARDKPAQRHALAVRLGLVQPEGDRGDVELGETGQQDDEPGS